MTTNSATLCCIVIPFFYIKMMKKRTLKASSLKHSVKKCMISVFWAKWTSLGQASSSPLIPFLATRLRYVLPSYVISIAVQTTNITYWLNQHVASVFQNLANIFLSEGIQVTWIPWNDLISYVESKIQSHLTFGTEVFMVKVSST